MNHIARELTLPLPDNIVSAWRSLESSSPDPSFFRSPDWVLSRIEALGLAESTKVRVWEEGDEVTAVMALTRSLERIHHSIPIGVPVLTNAAAGVGGADHTGWAARPDAHEAVVLWLEETRQTLLLRSLDQDLAGSRGPSGVVVERIRCPRLDLSNWDGPPRSFAKKIAYYRRRVEREGCVISTTPPGEVSPTHLETLRYLHMERFGGASVLARSSLDIQERLLGRSNGQLGPMVITVERGGETIAILWGLWFGGVFAYYQTGWLPAYKELSLGVVLVDEAIEAARHLGAKTFDFLRGPEPYKYRFGAEDRLDTTLLLPRGVSGWVLGIKKRLRSTSAEVDAGSA